MIRLSCNGRADHIDNSQRANPLLLTFPKRSQTVRSLTGLTDDHCQAVRIQKRLPVTELRSKLHTHRKTRKILDLDELMAYKIEGLIVLSHTLSSEKLASYNIPVIAIEREAEHICSVTTDNYMGSMQATSLLIRNQCDVLIHINVHVPENIPAYDRIRAFEETCREYHVPYELNLNVSGDSYQELFEQMRVIFQDIDSKYSGQKKGIFLSNDTYANIFLNLIFQKYNCLPDEYQIIGFDNSPIAAESIIPITTIGQQIDVIAQTTMELLVEQMNEMKKRKPAPLQKPIHKKITPVLIRRQTTGD